MSEANIVSKKWQEDVTLSGGSLPDGLYLVATPIGNLRDITLRALDVLSCADLVLAEDTRHSKRLFEKYMISTPMRPYHEHNAARTLPVILKALNEGQSVALISDAGTPLVSDPGFKLVRAVAENGHAIIPIPGASAVLGALCASAQPTDRFLFAGFAPPKTGARQKFFKELVSVPATLIFFEAPGRILASLKDMLAVFGPRPAVLARELTKIHETVIRTSLPDLIEQVSSQKIRGECVLVLGPPATGATTLSEQQIDAALIEALGRVGVKQAAKDVANICQKPVRELYARAVKLQTPDNA